MPAVSLVVVDKIAFASGCARKLAERRRQAGRQVGREGGREGGNINSIPIVPKRYVLNVREENPIGAQQARGTKFPG